MDDDDGRLLSIPLPCSGYDVLFRVSWIRFGSLSMFLDSLPRLRMLLHSYIARTMAHIRIECTRTTHLLVYA